MENPLPWHRHTPVAPPASDRIQCISPHLLRCILTSFCCNRDSQRKTGRIINISSVVGLAGNPGQANYAAAKAGVIGLTKSVAREYAKRGIKCNAVCPGYIATEMTEVLSDGIKEAVLNTIPMQR